ncbi:zinc finger, CCHC-type containing protein [Tanacetum coccineum]
MTDSRPVLEQYNELLGILRRFTQHMINMDESIKGSCIIDKLPHSWKDFKHTLKHLKEELTLRAYDNDKPKGNNVVGPSVVNMVEHKTLHAYNDNTDDDIAWWVDSGATVHVLNIVSDNIGSAFMSTSELKYSILWHARLGHVHFKRMQDMSRTKPFQNIKCETEVLELIHSDLCDLHATPSLGNKKYFVTFIDDASRTDRGGEYMDTLYFQYVGIIYETTAPYTSQQNGISERKNKVLKEMVNSMLSYSSPVMAVVSLPDPKLKTLGKRGIECIFVGYAEHSKAFRFYVIEPNDSVAINSIIESRDGIFDKHRFSSVPRPSQRSLVKGTEDSGGLVVSEKTSDEIEVAFWKEAINDEMDSIMGNDTWVLIDLPPGCRPMGCKWIFKRKLKIDGTIEKFKARLVIQGFKQKLGIDYFDTYALVACISTIRLLIAMASIHSLIIHQMDVKIAFLNGELEEEVYMNQPLGFIMPGNENKLCKLIKSLYGLKKAPKQWHQKFNEVVLSNDYLLNQADKCVYSKFDAFGKGVIIYLYVDDMLIFGTNQVQVDLTKEFLSSRFSMKDMGEADVILVSTPMDTCEKLMPNKGQSVSQLEYSRVIGCLMYAMTCTRPDIAFAVGKLSRYTSNPGTQHMQAIQRVLKYLKKTMNYRLMYSGYPLVLEGYTDASWTSNTKDNSSTSGWVFLLGGGTISWASKKQTCITCSTMESEFISLAAAGKEAEWLTNLLLEIPLWVKPITPISIRCDSAATLAKAYSQMYNGKSRHLGVRHSMIRELIMNEVVSDSC